MTYTFITACFLLLAFYKNQRDLHMFQQNSYRIERYLKWRKGQRKFRGYDVAVLYSVICFTTSAFVTVDLGRLGLQVCGYLFLLVSGLGFKWHIEASPQKKELVYTDRVKRLSLTMLILYGLFFLVSLYLPDLLVIIFSGLIVYLSFVTVLKANYINKPMEAHINNSFIQDAKRRLKENPNLIIIGITGSYGKTSVKNILYHLLSQKYNVLMTPESYNTLLGVTRTIRERLLPTHEVFIVEMGAKQTGDIKEICDLVDPHIGIITSIGPQHLDTFKSIENVQATKGELFQGVRPGGKIYMNLGDPLIMGLPKRRDVDTHYFGLEKDIVADFKDADKKDVFNKAYMASDIYLDKKGTHFTCRVAEKDTYDMTTKLLGAHNIGNMIGSIAIAGDLGVSLKRLNTLLYDIEPVEHRLSYRSTGLNYTIIDDAFNSNPIGSKNALEVLGQMAGNKKIVITPGMIELGDKQYELNKAFGVKIAEVCDHTILVGPKQTKPIQDGLKEAGYPQEKLTVSPNLKVAFATLNQLVEEGDVVLLENDLPDAFNE